MAKQNETTQTRQETSKKSKVEVSQSYDRSLERYAKRYEGVHEVRGLCSIDSVVPIVSPSARCNKRLLDFCHASMVLLIQPLILRSIEYTRRLKAQESASKFKYQFMSLYKHLFTAMVLAGCCRSCVSRKRRINQEIVLNIAVSSCAMDYRQRIQADPLVSSIRSDTSLLYAVAQLFQRLRHFCVLLLQVIYIVVILCIQRLLFLLVLQI